MQQQDDPASTTAIDYDRPPPYSVLAYKTGEGIVITPEGEMTIDAAAQLLVAKLEAFDWQAYATQHAQPGKVVSDALRADLTDIEFVASLVAQINLYQARLLWSIKVPDLIGMMRMLDLAHEEEELRYQQCLTAERTLTDELLLDYVLEQGPFMDRWLAVRADLIPPLPTENPQWQSAK